MVPGSFGEPEAGGPLHVAVAQKSAQVNSQDIYVAVGAQGVVDEFNVAGEYLKQLAIPLHSTPLATTTGPSGEVYVAVELTNETGWAVEEYNPAGELIAQNDGSAAGGFGAISGVAVDAAGRLYVSDSAKLVVDEFDPSRRLHRPADGRRHPAERLCRTDRRRRQPAERGCIRRRSHGRTGRRHPGRGRRLRPGRLRRRPLPGRRGSLLGHGHEREARSPDRPDRREHELPLRIRTPGRSADEHSGDQRRVQARASSVSPPKFRGCSPTRHTSFASS